MAQSNPWNYIVAIILQVSTIRFIQNQVIYMQSRKIYQTERYSYVLKKNNDLAPNFFAHRGFCWFLFLGQIALGQHYNNIPMSSNAIFHGSMNTFFQMKIFGTFLIDDPNIDCGCLLEMPQWGSPNKHQQSMFWAKTRKMMSTPANTTFSHIKGDLRWCSLDGLVNVIKKWLFWNLNPS